MAHMTSFNNGSDLADALAQDVANALRASIEKQGSAVIAVSGGSTPARFFAALSREELDWSSVHVTLVDERWVDEQSDRSNAKLVKENLLINNAASAQFIPLVSAFDTPEKGLGASNALVSSLPLPFAAVILGMGGDGHTASFFPGGDQLAEAVDLSTQGPLISMQAEGAGEPRVTFVLSQLLRTDFLALHIEGAAKKSIYEEALAGDDINALPIRSVLQTTDILKVYWCG